jgi:hypothetical protein
MSESPGGGDILPTTTSDEDETGWGEDLSEHATQTDDDLERLRREVPPHHGG